MNRSTVINDESRGFDYDLQVWFKDYIIQNCGHPKHMKEQGCCNGNRYAGIDIRTINK